MQRVRWVFGILIEQGGNGHGVQPEGEAAVLDSVGFRFPVSSAFASFDDQLFLPDTRLAHLFLQAFHDVCHLASLVWRVLHASDEPGSQLLQLIVALADFHCPDVAVVHLHVCLPHQVEVEQACQHLAVQLADDFRPSLSDVIGYDCSCTLVIAVLKPDDVIEPRAL